MLLFYLPQNYFFYPNQQNKFLILFLKKFLTAIIELYLFAHRGEKNYLCLIMRLNKHYSISLNDISRLERIAEVRRPLWVILLLCLGGAIGVILIAGAIIFITPLKTLLPGYMGEDQRKSSIEALIRLDSISSAYEARQQWLDNVITVLNTNREPSDSLQLVVNPNPMTTDSLIGPSKEESKFVARMQQREKFNISILAPLAAEGLQFSSPSPGAIFLDSERTTRKARLAVGKGATIGATADGTVVDVEYSPSEGGYCIIMQHRKGFLSRISRIGRPLVKRGEKVDLGQAIGIALDATGRETALITLEIWRNGQALAPRTLIEPNADDLRNALTSSANDADEDK